MAGGSDWLPSSRAAILVMAQTWLFQIRTRGKHDWQMSDEEIAEFEDAVNSAENGSTEVSLRSAFYNLSSLMRVVKKRYLRIPPLTEEEIISLGLKVRGAPQNERE